MDLGATLCRPRQPRCAACPGDPSAPPMPPASPTSSPGAPARPAHRSDARLAFLLTRPTARSCSAAGRRAGLLGGLHELPSSPWQEGELALETALGHAPAAADWRLHAPPVRHAFTHFLLELTLAQGITKATTKAITRAGPSALWCRADQLDRLALPTVMRKVLRRAGLEPPAQAASPKR